MTDDRPTRRTIISGAAAAAMLFGSGREMVARAATASAGRSPVSAAVMRVPVIVPQTIDSLADVRRRNIAAMVDSIERAMKRPNPPRLIVFPVLQAVSSKRGTSGIPIDMVALDLVSTPLDQTAYGPVVEACRRHKIYVATSTQEKTTRLPGRYFHAGFVMGPEGLVLRSPKTQARSAKEISYIRDLKDEYVAGFGPDSILPVAKTPIGTIGCYIEAEALVLDAARKLAARGAEIIVHPSAEDDETPWLAIKQAVAYQTQTFLLTGATSRNIEKDDPTGGWSGGASTIFGPDGRLLASLGGRDEGIATAMLDLSLVQANREKNAFKTTPAPVIYQ